MAGVQEVTDQNDALAAGTLRDSDMVIGIGGTMTTRGLLSGSWRETGARGTAWWRQSTGTLRPSCTLTRKGSDPWARRCIR